MLDIHIMSVVSRCRSTRRRYSVSRIVLLLFVSIGGCGLFLVVTAHPSSSSTPPPPPPPRPQQQQQAANVTSNSTTAATTTTRLAKQERIVQITETEVYDGKRWKAPGNTEESSVPSTTSTSRSRQQQRARRKASSTNLDTPPPTLRWTDTITGELVASPDTYTLDEDEEEEWTSDWKIVTASHRDEFGWEYHLSSRQQGGLPLRRRIWLRTCRRTTQSKDDLSSSRRSERRTKTKKSQKRSFMILPQGFRNHRWVQRIQDEWNFKGFGWTFYKSLVFKESFGVALRLPITYNLASFEAHPSLPSASWSLAVYFYPLTIILFFNASVRYEWLQWLITTTVASVLYSACWLVWTFCIRGLIIAISALSFPVTQRIINPSLPAFVMEPPVGWKSGPHFSPNVEERIGYSHHWRWSPESGYEQRNTVWHYLAPSVVAILQNGLKVKPSSIPTWLVRRVPAVGLSTGGPLPVEPYLTSSALLSLSGFYFQMRRRKKTTSVSSSPSMPVKVSAAEVESMVRQDDSKDLSALAASEDALETKKKKKTTSPKSKKVLVSSLSSTSAGTS